MAENSKISWCHNTFNPWIGCSKVSPGCTNCYAEAFAGRYLKVKWGPKENRHKTSASNWRNPERWNFNAARSGIIKRVFCASLSDIFEDNAQLTPWRKDLFDLIAKTQYLYWLLLTKRPENFKRLMPPAWRELFPVNVWPGASICNQQEYDRIMPLLKDLKRELGIRITFVSFEPLLGPIDLKYGAADWNIIGGESGFLKYARPMHLDWAGGLIRQVKAAGGLVFFKQMGSHMAKKLNMADPKGEMGIERLSEAYDIFKTREIPLTDKTLF